MKCSRRRKTGYRSMMGNAFTDMILMMRRSWNDIRSVIVKVVYLGCIGNLCKATLILNIIMAAKCSIIYVLSIPLHMSNAAVGRFLISEWEGSISPMTRCLCWASNTSKSTALVVQLMFCSLRQLRWLSSQMWLGCRLSPLLTSLDIPSMLKESSLSNNVSNVY